MRKYIPAILAFVYLVTIPVAAESLPTLVPTISLEDVRLPQATATVTPTPTPAPTSVPDDFDIEAVLSSANRTAPRVTYTSKMGANTHLAFDLQAGLPFSSLDAYQVFIENLETGQTGTIFFDYGSNLYGVIQEGTYKVTGIAYNGTTEQLTHEPACCPEQFQIRNGVLTDIVLHLGQEKVAAAGAGNFTTDSYSEYDYNARSCMGEGSTGGSSPFVDASIYQDDPFALRQYVLEMQALGYMNENYEYTELAQQVMDAIAIDAAATPVPGILEGTPRPISMELEAEGTTSYTSTPSEMHGQSQTPSGGQTVEVEMITPTPLPKERLKDETKNVFLETLQRVASAAFLVGCAYIIYKRRKSKQ